MIDDAFESVWRFVCRELSCAKVNSNHEFHAFSFASINNASKQNEELDNCSSAADVRTVILRDFDEYSRKISFHTDIRSSKCSQIASVAKSVALFYSRDLKLQLKFKTFAYLHYKNSLAASRWKQTSLQARRTYLKTYAPGTILTADAAILPNPYLSKSPTLDESEIGFENFAVIELNFYSVDILKLNHQGNECFRIQWSGDDTTCSIIAP
jgi:pyridoxamine 5'-phosphate oxidase